MARWKTICLSLVFLASFKLAAQSNSGEEAEKFILEVMASYKNPLAYYPLRRDIFLPSQSEIDSLEMAMDRYSSPHLLYQVLFVEDDSLKRESFVDIYGRPLFPPYSNFKKLSKKGDYQFFKSRQRRLLNANPNLGKFLLYNQQFKNSKNPQEH